jgi:cytochrome oxidase assembly protein ShyY1
MPLSNELWSRAKAPASIFALLSLIAVCVLFFFLGKWQWDRTQDILDAERAATMSAVPVSQIEQPMKSQDYGRTVTAAGFYIDRDQVRIGSRLSRESVVGDWIVSALELDTGQSIAVLRGWVPDGQAFATPDQEISIEGVLQPSDTFYDAAVEQDGEVASIDSQRLSVLWNTTLLDGYIVVQEQNPVAEGSPEIVPPTISTADVAFPLQNFFYAIQWWVFALFGVVIYVRWLVIGSKLRT